MKMHELLSDESKLDRGDHGCSDAEGNDTRFNNPLACKWCLVIAACKCYCANDLQITLILNRLLAKIQARYPRITNLVHASKTLPFLDISEILLELDI